MLKGSNSEEETIVNNIEIPYITTDNVIFREDDNQAIGPIVSPMKNVWLKDVNERFKLWKLISLLRMQDSRLVQIEKLWVILKFVSTTLSTAHDLKISVHLKSFMTMSR